MVKKNLQTTAADHDLRTALIAASVELLNDQGPDALQTRKIAAAAGTSTMAVYTNFGGIRGLIAGVAEEGLHRFSVAQAAVAHTDDPVADFIVTGLVYRQFAIDNPHLYRLMFGVTSAHGINAPSRIMFDTTHITPQHSSAEYLFQCVQRMMALGCIQGSPDNLALVSITAAKFWTVIHGFVMLELAGFWGTNDDATLSILTSLTTDLLVALGDSIENIKKSITVAGVRIATTQKENPREVQRDVEVSVP